MGDEIRPGKQKSLVDTVFLVLEALVITSHPSPVPSPQGEGDHLSNPFLRIKSVETWVKNSPLKGGKRSFNGLTICPNSRYLPAHWLGSSAVEQGNHNPLVGGSNPSSATILRFQKIPERPKSPCKTRVFLLLLFYNVSKRFTTSGGNWG